MLNPQTLIELANLISNGDLNKVRDFESHLSNADQVKVEEMIHSNTLPATLEALIQETQTRASSKTEDRESGQPCDGCCM